MFVVIDFLHSRRIESQRFAHSFIEDVAATQAEFVKVSCAIVFQASRERKRHVCVNHMFNRAIFARRGEVCEQGDEQMVTCQITVQDELYVHKHIGVRDTCHRLVTCGSCIF